MKRIILNVVVMLIAFVFGAAFDSMIWPHSEDAPAQQVQPGIAMALEPVTQPAEAITPIPVPVAKPTPHFIFDFDPARFDVYGAFYVMGPEAKEFKDFSITVELQGHHDRPSGYITAEVSSNDRYESYPAVFAFATERRLFFVTSPGPESGFEYRFDGEFLRKDFESVAGKDKAVLRGTLTRSKDGRTITERVVNLSFVYIGC